MDTNTDELAVTAKRMSAHFNSFGFHFWMMIVPIRQGMAAEHAQSRNQKGWKVPLSASGIPFSKGAINSSIVTNDTGRDIIIK